jgi:TPR repeat protein
VKHLVVVLFVVTGCAADPLGVAEPKQRGVVDPMSDRGRRAYDQRARDCFEMPSAQACYDAGMSYELGIGRDADAQKALELYDRACELERDDEFCGAAARMRARR